MLFKKIFIKYTSISPQGEKMDYKIISILIAVLSFLIFIIHIFRNKTPIKSELINIKNEFSSERPELNLDGARLFIKGASQNIKKDFENHKIDL